MSDYSYDPNWYIEAIETGEVVATNFVNQQEVLDTKEFKEKADEGNFTEDDVGQLELMLHDFAAKLKAAKFWEEPWE